jgi:hypothetical protein
MNNFVLFCETHTPQNSISGLSFETVEDVISSVMSEDDIKWAKVYDIQNQSYTQLVGDSLNG